MNNLSDAEFAVVRRQLGTLSALEAAIPEASGHLDTNGAATWERNPNEPRDRQRLFDDMRRRLCGFRHSAGCRARRCRLDAGGLMDAASLQDRISRGLGTAARRIGTPTDAYRPRGTLRPARAGQPLPASPRRVHRAGRQVRQTQRLRRRAVVRRVRRCLYPPGRLSRAGQRHLVCRRAAAAASGALRADQSDRLVHAPGGPRWRRRQHLRRDRAEHRDAVDRRLARQRARSPSASGRPTANLPSEARPACGPSCCRRWPASSCGRPT